MQILNIWYNWIYCVQTSIALSMIQCIVATTVDWASFIVIQQIVEGISQLMFQLKREKQNDNVVNIITMQQQ